MIQFKTMQRKRKTCLGFLVSSSAVQKCGDIVLGGGM
jgi:hypothetical protein